MKNTIKLILSILTIIFFVGDDALCQIHQGGLIHNEEVFMQVPLSPLVLALNEKDKIPQEISLKKWAPSIKNQGIIASGVGWAVGYGAMTMMYTMHHNITDPQTIDNEAFSALFIYNSLSSGNCNIGIGLAKAGDFLQEQGNCRYKDFDITINHCQKSPSTELKEKAKHYKVKNYYRIYNQDDEGEVIVNKVKNVLANKYPVVVGMQLRKNFFQPSSEYWAPNIGSTEDSEKHAMVVVGYDDKKEAFELMNSWGTEWGNDGYIWVKYHDFHEFLLGAYCYEMNDDDTNQKETITYYGGFDLRYPLFDKDELIQFESAKAYKAEKYFYELEKKDWEENDMYQLVVSETQLNRAIYVFSFDQKGTTIHWPRQYADSTKKRETSLIPYKNVKIIIPEEGKALYKRTEGTDHIIILYAYDQISDFEERVNNISQQEGTIEERFLSSFEDLLIPQNQIEYSKDKMKFSCETNSKKMVIPMLIQLKGL